MPASMSWKSPRRLAAGSSLACADLGGELPVAVGQRGRVEGAVGGGGVRCYTVDAAGHADRAGGVEELDGGQLAGEGQLSGGARSGLRGCGGRACHGERGQRARRDPCPDLHRESLLGKPESARMTSSLQFLLLDWQTIMT